MTAATDSASEPVLQGENLHKSYYDGTRTLDVLRGASLTVAGGETVSIMGASGAGKSTLLHLLGALDRPSEGTIRLRGTELSALSSAELAAVRARSIGFIFQFHHLLAEFSALENVMMPALILRESPAAARARAEQLLESVGLADRLTHRPVKLSGGEQQRVALARALMNNPDLILADEPTGNLDAKTAAAVIDMLWDHTRGQNKSLVIVTHDPDIGALAARRLRLRDGLLHEDA